MSPSAESVSSTLPVGTKLGPYEILGFIGAGGMGEVHRARDTRLNREVAVKVLPEGLRGHPTRLRRFEKEARAAGALHHPNLVVVHDVGSHEGIPYVVTELLDGGSLRERMGEPMPARKVVEIGRQIAQGLAAVHEKGIVHRDLKPENLFVTRDGRVKILDFGLAKIARPDVEAGEVGGEDSTLSGVTEPGTVMGTMGYMSPEQVRGREADARSDVFSLGVVLHEMLTGRRLFRRESAVETMNAILTDDPPPLAPTGAPPALERVVLRCLERNPDDRYDSAQKLVYALEALSFDTSSRRVSAVAPPHRRGLMAAGLLLVAGAVGAGGYLLGRRDAEPGQPRFEQLTFRRGAVQSARFALGGHSIVYGAAWDGDPLEVYEAVAGGGEARALGLAPAEILAASREGELAVLLRVRRIDSMIRAGTLARVRLVGGQPRELAEDVLAADWVPGGDELAIVRAGHGGSQLELPVGNAVYHSPGTMSGVRVSPDGRWLAIVDHSRPGDDDGALVILDRQGKVRVRSADWVSLFGLAWRDDEVWFTGSRDDTRRGLRAVNLDGKERLLLQAATTLTLFDIAGDGTLLMGSEARRYGVMKGGESGPERDLSWFDGTVAWDLTPDGETLVAAEVIEGGGPGYSMFLRRTDGSDPVRLGSGSGGSLSPDGKWVLAVQTQPAPPRLVALPVGPGQARVLTDGSVLVSHGSRWLPDGKRIMFPGSEGDAGFRVYVLDVSDGAATGKPRAITPVGTRTYFGGNPVSPDGKWVAAADAEDRLALYPVDGGEARPVAGDTRGKQVIRFSGDGRALYLFVHGEVPARVVRHDLDTGAETPWKELVPADGAGVTHVCPIVITPDGRHYAYSFVRHMSELFLVRGVR